VERERAAAGRCRDRRAAPRGAAGKNEEVTA
jgi:hypothetical protein